MNPIRVIKCQINHFHKWSRKVIKRLAVYCCPNIYDKLRYKDLSGKTIDYRNPTDLNQKLFWLNRYWQPEVKTLCADKYRMREYLRLKNLEQLSVPLLGVWDSPDEIDFDILPNQFVLKCNHGCAYNIICRDKTTFDKEKALKQLKLWMKEDYSKYYGERHYSKISRCVICEKYLGDNLPDIKVYCFNGSPEYILICQDRKDDGEGAKFAIYSTKWEKLDYVRDKYKYDKDIECPPKFSEILQYSKKLSEDFPFVRLDFYIVNDAVYLGEFTFTPQGNYITYKNAEILDVLGSKLVLPSIRKE